MTDDDQSGQSGRRELRSFGRRRGRRPSPRQAALLRDLLPRIALPLAGPPPIPLETLFDPPACEVWLEIGFGGGEHLLAQARANPQVGFIGCEPFQDGVVKALRAIEAENLANIRLVGDDARPVLRWLPDAGIARVFILFPDPWPKKRHHKRRLIAQPTLAELARIMRKGGTLRIATDVGAYAGVILLEIERTGAFRWQATGPRDWRERPADWPGTRYEAKAQAAGRRCAFLSLERR
jgi:tRNA (guanine-N7-)-methyltransferase